MEVSLGQKIGNHTILDQKRVSILGHSSPSVIKKNLREIPKFATKKWKIYLTVNRDGFNGFDSKTEATFGSTLFSVFSLMDFLTSVKSAVQFSVKCVKYVHFFACRLPHMKEWGEICHVIFQKIREMCKY